MVLKADLDSQGCPIEWDGMTYWTHPLSLINGAPEDPPQCSPGGRA